MSMGRFHPFCPTVSVIALAEADKLKLGLGTVSSTVVLFVVAPNAPVIVSGYVPGTALLAAVTLRRTGLEEVAVDSFKDAVTPAGAPDTATLTTPLLAALGFATLMVEVT
jgi:hypothetical protein